MDKAVPGAAVQGCYGVPMFELLVAGITGLYLAANQGSNDSETNYIATMAFWTAIAILARRLMPSA